ncbi:MAG: hypothetical protein HC857_13265 [Synechococcales cyanobacterium RU_4_20]|nr:hypothetical protein [Synechococcales cyanobacterium RU_4_20]
MNSFQDSSVFSGPILSAAQDFAALTSAQAGIQMLPTYNGKEYLLTTAKTWEEAQAEAVSLGGNLVTVNDAAEEAWLRQTFGTTESLWIGLTDRVQEGTFRWADGEAVTYTNWAPGQPDNYQPVGGEDYASINFRDTQSGTTRVLRPSIAALWSSFRVPKQASLA